jgi:hypothetical protein
MTAIKLALLLCLAVSCLAVTQDFYDSDICSPGSCVSCSYLNNEKYTGLSCGLCYKKQIIFSSKDKDPSFGTKCGDDLSGKCIFANISPQEISLSQHHSSESGSKVIRDILESNLSIMIKRYGPKNSHVQMYKERLELFAKNPSETEWLKSSNDQTCLACDFGYILKDGKCSVPTKQIQNCLDYN